MSGHSFRFIHSGGFRLHRPLCGVADVSESCQAFLIEAPYSSASEVFSAAIREDIDFLLLTGDLLDPALSGPKAITFLRDGFSQLAEQRIMVYWAASQTDLGGDWISVLEWPENVKIFAADHAERVVQTRDDLVLAELVGRSWNGRRQFRATEFESSSEECLRIAVLPEQLEIPSTNTAADYWAFGGSNAASTPHEDPFCAHSPGSVQGISPDETGTHGCTLVDVDGDGAVRTRMIHTDCVRWCHERIPVSLGMSHQTARQAIRARVKHLLAEIAKPMLVHWTVTGEDRFDSLFIQTDERNQILEWVRDEFAEGSPPVWSVALELEPAEDLPPEWCDEDSILGDYLRVVQKYAMEPDTPLGLGTKLDGAAPKELLAALSPLTGDERRRLLQSAALLGADLLRGDESPGRS